MQLELGCRVDVASRRIWERQERVPVEGQALGTAQRSQRDEAFRRLSQGRADLHRFGLQVQQRSESVPTGAHRRNRSRLPPEQLFKVFFVCFLLNFIMRGWNEIKVSIKRHLRRIFFRESKLGKINSIKLLCRPGSPSNLIRYWINFSCFSLSL